MDSSKNQYVKNTEFFCKNYDTPNGRWYAKDEGEKPDIFFPSVTTVLSVLDKGKGDDLWLGNSPSYDSAMDYAMAAAKTGSIVHWYIMKLLQGAEIDTTNDFVDEDTEERTRNNRKVNKRLEGFVRFYEDHNNPAVIANEISLFNPRLYRKQPLYPYAGQADQVYKIDDKYILCDIKTGADYPSHGLQLTAYKLIWDSLYPDHKIDEMWGLYLSDSWIKKPYRIKKYDFQPEDWLTTVDLWQWYKGPKNIKPKFKKEYDTVFELNLIYKEEDTDGI